MNLTAKPLTLALAVAGALTLALPVARAANPCKPLRAQDEKPLCGKESMRGERQNRSETRHPSQKLQALCWESGGIEEGGRTPLEGHQAFHQWHVLLRLSPGERRFSSQLRQTLSPSGTNGQGTGQNEDHPPRRDDPDLHGGADGREAAGVGLERAGRAHRLHGGRAEELQARQGPGSESVRRQESVRTKEISGWSAMVV